MANYKVGDLDVTISGVSKDAVSSLDEVIKQLDTLQGKLGVVSRGFNGAFRNINNTAVRATTQGYIEIKQAVQSTNDSAENFNKAFQNGVKKSAKSIEEATDKLRAWQERMRENTFAGRENVFMGGNNKFALVPYQARQSLVAVSEAQESVNTAFERLNILLNMGTYSRLSADVGNLATQWKNLYTTMQKSDVADQLTGGQFSAEAQNRLTRLTQEYLNKKRVIDEVNEAFKRLGMTEQELALYDYQQANATRKQRIEYLQLMLATGQAGEKTAEYRRELKRLTKEQEQADKAAGKSAKGGLSKLIGKISRIALYRTIRRGLQMITQTFTESIQSYAQVDDSINDMMSQLTSSTKVIQLSLGTIIFPILQAITPVVEQISYGFADMANTINQAMAKMQGLTTYTKINANALQDYRKQINKTSGALFDFDKFRALSGNKNTATTFLSTDEIGEETKAVSQMMTTIQSVTNIIQGLWNIIQSGWSGIKPIIATALEIIEVSIIPTLSTVVDWVGKVFKKLDDLKLIHPILSAIGVGLAALYSVKVIKGITTLISKFNLWYLAVAAVGMAIGIISNWDDFSRGTKIAITVISGLTTALLAAATAAMVLHGTLTLGTAIPLITAAVASGAIFIRGLVDIPKYAMGASDIDGGSLFIAGEAGKTEMVYTGDNGKTNVANVQQMAQAVYQGTYQATMDWWKSAKNEVGGDVYLDGEKIYQSVGRTASKHGKKFANV